MWYCGNIVAGQKTLADANAIAANLHLRIIY